MFDFDAAQTPEHRMNELERFLIFWLDTRMPEYGEPDPLRRLVAVLGL